MYTASDMNPFTFPAERCALVNPHLADASLPFTGVGILQTFYILEVVKGILCCAGTCFGGKLSLCKDKIAFSVGFLGMVSINLSPAGFPSWLLPLSRWTLLLFSWQPAQWLESAVNTLWIRAGKNYKSSDLPTFLVLAKFAGSLTAKVHLGLQNCSFKLICQVWSWVFNFFVQFAFYTIEFYSLKDALVLQNPL